MKGIKYIIKKKIVKCNQSGIEDLLNDWYELKKKLKKKWFDSALTHSPSGSAPLHSSVRPPSVLLPQELPLVLPHTVWRLPQNSGHLARQHQRGRRGILTWSLAKSYHYPNHSILLPSNSTVDKKSYFNLKIKNFKVAYLRKYLELEADKTTNIIFKLRPDIF